MFFQDCTFWIICIQELFYFEFPGNLLCGIIGLRIVLYMYIKFFCLQTSFCLYGSAPPPPTKPPWVRITSLSFVNFERHVVVLRELQILKWISFQIILYIFLCIYLALPLWERSAPSPNTLGMNYISLVHASRKREVVVRVPRTRDSIFVYVKLIKISKLTKSLNA